MSLFSDATDNYSILYDAPTAYSTSNYSLLYDTPTAYSPSNYSLLDQGLQYDPYFMEPYNPTTTGSSTNYLDSILKYGTPILNSGMGLLTSSQQADAYRTAAEQQAAALQQAQQLSQLQYLENVERMQPYYALGLQGIEQISPFLSQIEPYNYEMYQASPEYQAQMYATEQAQDQLKSMAGASGMYGSGNLALAMQQRAQQDALAGYQQGLGNYWGQAQNYYNMLSPFVTGGQNAAVNLGTMGAGNITNQVNALTDLGQSTSSGTLGQADAWSRGIENLGTQLSTLAYL